MRIMICGAGTMGSGIAQVMAEAGLGVYLMDISDEFVNRGLAIIEKNLSTKVEKGKLSLSQKDKIMKHISGTTSLEKVKEVKLVLECASENMEVKKNLFKQLDSVSPADTILATNTSALSISELAAVTSRPDMFIGIHFSNPAPVMKWVEIIKGYATSEETFQFAKKLTEDVGKVPVKVEESPGFVLNRMLIPMINEAIYLLMEGVASKEDIDITMKLGANHPIGPLALADLIGLDVVLYVMETLHREFCDSKYRPCPLLRKMVRAGYLGRKTKRGFYTY